MAYREKYDKMYLEPTMKRRNRTQILVLITHIKFLRER